MSRIKIKFVKTVYFFFVLLERSFKIPFLMNCINIVVAGIIYFIQLTGFNIKSNIGYRLRELGIIRITVFICIALAVLFSAGSYTHPK